MPTPADLAVHWQQAMGWLFMVFSVCCTGIGVCSLLWLLAVIAYQLLRRLVLVAVLVEAAREARRQGRAPCLKAFQWLERRHGR